MLVARGARLGSRVGKSRPHPQPWRQGLRAAPGRRPLRTRGGVPGSRRGCCGGGRGARDGGASERAPGGTRKRRALALGARGVAGGARGQVSARGRRARPRGPRREESRRPEPSPRAGTLRRRLCAVARPREGASEWASERRAGGHCWRPKGRTR